MPEVGGAVAGREVLLVGLGEGVGVLRGEAGARVLAVLGDRGGDEVVAPRAGGLGQPALEVGVSTSRMLAARGGWTTKCTRAVADSLRRTVNSTRLAAQLLLEDRREPLADGGVVAVAGQVDQDGDVAAVGVAADEDRT